MQRSGGRIFLVLIAMALCLVPAVQAVSGPSHAWHDIRATFQGEWRQQQNLSAYDTVLAFRPDVAAAWEGRGDTLFWYGKYTDALLAYNRSLELDASSARAWGGKGNTLLMMWRVGEALDAFNQSLALNPQSVTAWQGKGRAWIFLDNYNESLDAYESAIALDPGEPASWEGKGWAYMYNDHPAEGRAACEEAVKTDRQYVKGWYCVGVGYLELNRTRDAQDIFYHALAIDPGYADAWNGLGYSLKPAGFGPEMKAYDNALLVDPENYRAWRSKSDLYDWVNMTDEAYYSINRSLSIYPENLPYHDKRIRMDEKYGRNVTAA